MSHRRRKSCPSTCARKQSYPTRADADHQADALRVAMPFSFVRVYRCPVCRLWYVTSEAQRPKAKRGGR
jgi:hypothetical protein